MAPMKEALTSAGGAISVRTDAPIPKAGADELVVKVSAVGVNPKDYKTELAPYLPINQGNDLAGIVTEVGSAAGPEFKIGDRVFAYHGVGVPHGAHAEYCVVKSYLTAHLPGNVKYEEAATVPLAAITAAVALFHVGGLPQPWVPAKTKTPILIYGASGAVGAFAVKLARLANIHPIIAVAGAGTSFVETLIDKEAGDAALDYRVGAEKLHDNVKSALMAAQVSKVDYAFDAVAVTDVARFCAAWVKPHGKFVSAMPIAPDANLQLAEGVSPDFTACVFVQDSPYTPPGGLDFGRVLMTMFARWLGDGSLKPHPHELVDRGLDGLQGAVDALKAGKASAKKFVVSLNAS